MNPLLQGCALVLALLAWSCRVAASEAAAPVEPTYDSVLAEQLGADEYGMRGYMLVILKTGPTPVTDADERKAMFAGHFANMKRHSEAGKLALAGPLDGVEGRRGLFVFAVASIDEARALTETDPVIIKGEMVAEYHTWYGSAGLMMLRDVHAKIARKKM